jgi:hypothetical protein
MKNNILESLNNPQLVSCLRVNSLLKSSYRALYPEYIIVAWFWKNYLKHNNTIVDSVFQDNVFAAIERSVIDDS